MGGWSGESIDFAVFFEVSKWFTHEATNHDCPEYYIFAEMLSPSKNVFFLFNILGKKNMSIYNDFDACNELCIILLYILPYTTIYIYTHYLTNLLFFFFTIVYVSRKICIWYWTDMSAISSCKFCIFWKVFCILSCCSWVLFTKEHVQIEHALLQKMV